MSKRNLYVFLVLFLAACAPIMTPSPTIDATALFDQVDATAQAQLTETAAHQLTLTMTFTPAVTPSLLPPTPLPPTPTFPLMMTPDEAQVEHWQEYQTELAKVVLSIRPELASDPQIYKDAFCEWDILGESGREVYVYVVCVIAKGIADARSPAIIYLEPNGSIQKVKLPEPKATSSMFDYRPFPTDVQEKFCYYFDPFPSDLPPCPYGSTYPRPRLDVLYSHIEYRKTHPNEPPLIVLSALPTAIPTP
jgi:hypothetical protein